MLVRICDGNKMLHTGVFSVSENEVPELIEQAKLFWDGVWLALNIQPLKEKFEFKSEGELRQETQRKLENIPEFGVKPSRPVIQIQLFN